METTTTSSTASETVARDQKLFSLKVTSITGTSFNIHVSKTETVQQLKDRIFNTLHIVPELQRLTFQEKVLEYGLLEEYGLEEGSTIFLSPVLKAGTASSTKRSLNIDQKSVSELIRSLPQEQLAILLNQKKPVTVTAKMGDHVVVFTLVPSDSGEACHDSSPSPIDTSSNTFVSPSSPSSPSPFVTTRLSSSSRREHRHQSQQSQQPSLVELVPAPSEELNLTDRVSLIRKRLSLKRVLDDIERQKMEQEGVSRSKKHRREHRHHQHKPSSSRRLRQSRRSEKLIEGFEYPQQQELVQQEQPFQQEQVIEQQVEEQKMEVTPVSSCESIVLSPAPTQVPLVLQKEEEVATPSSSCDSISFKCSKCCKKLKPMRSYTCRCGHMFCADHRHQNVNSNSEKGHNCSFDYKALGREELRASNPLVQGPKIQHI